MAVTNLYAKEDASIFHLTTMIGIEYRHYKYKLNHPIFGF